MRVGIDYLPAVTHAPGVGRYAREVVRALVELGHGGELALFDWGGEARTVGEPALGLAGARVVRVSRRLPRRVLGWLSRRGFAADRLAGGCEFFLRVHPGWPPVRDARTLLAVSELPPEGSEGERDAARRLGGEDHWIVFAAEGRRRLVEGLGLPEDRVHHLPVGCDHWRREPAPPPPLPERPNLLVLGGVREAREPLRVLEAFETLFGEGVVGGLTWVGPPGDAAEAFARRLSFGAGRSAVTWIREPSEDDMPEHVERSTVLVHLSRDELTAVTPLEAFCFGRGAVVSDLPAFREALGDLAEYAPAAGGSRGRLGLLDAVRGGLEGAGDPELTRRRQELAYRSTWRDHAKALLALLASLS